MGQKRYHCNEALQEPDLFLSGKKERELTQKLHRQLKAIVEECFPDNAAFINCVEALGIPVITECTSPWRLKLCMKLASMDFGYNAPMLKGYTRFVQVLKAFCPYHTNVDFSRGVIILLEEGNHFPFLTSQFYHALAYQIGLQGYSDTACKLYRQFERKYHCQLNPKMLSKLSYEEGLQLRYAIRRERESLNFLKSMVLEVFIPKNNAKLLESGEAQA